MFSDDDFRTLSMLLPVFLGLSCALNFVLCCCCGGRQPTPPVDPEILKDEQSDDDLFEDDSPVVYLMKTGRVVHTTKCQHVKRIMSVNPDSLRVLRVCAHCSQKKEN